VKGDFFEVKSQVQLVTAEYMLLLILFYLFVPIASKRLQVHFVKIVQLQGEYLPVLLYL